MTKAERKFKMFYLETAIDFTLLHVAVNKNAQKAILLLFISNFNTGFIDWPSTTHAASFTSATKEVPEAAFGAWAALFAAVTQTVPPEGLVVGRVRGPRAIVGQQPPLKTNT